ncbi:hypothetical protein TIFTF001_023325 [Ficus carica]|uniref:Uncharacterized protein n=1 Tax=Ficus carica TaxID=3494 RepID=A0AA88ANA8_FICCA|nr:hypothetical protein TIFTF001_023325 [Ficus carica]
MAPPGGRGHGYPIELLVVRVRWQCYVSPQIPRLRDGILNSKMKDLEAHRLSGDFATLGVQPPRRGRIGSGWVFRVGPLFGGQGMSGWWLVVATSELTRYRGGAPSTMVLALRGSVFLGLHFHFVADVGFGVGPHRRSGWEPGRLPELGNGDGGEGHSSGF